MYYVQTPANQLALQQSTYSPSSNTPLSYNNSTAQSIQDQQNSFNISPSDAGKVANKLITNNPASSGNGIFSGITNSVNQAGTSLGFAPGIASAAGPSNFAFANMAADASLPWSAANGLAGTGTTAATGASTASGALPWASGGTQAGSLTSASLTGTLGAAGIGAFAGNFLGKIGGNSTGGSIGGGVGAGIGMMVGGPLGAGIGGFIGGIAGGFIGGAKPSDKTMVGGIDLTGNVIDEYQSKQSSTGGKFSQENSDFRNTVQSGASNLAKFLTQNGAVAKGDASQFVFKVGSRDGYELQQVNQSNGQHKVLANVGQDANKYIDTVSKSMVSQYNIPPELQTKLSKMNLNSFFGADNSSAITPQKTVPNITVTDTQFADYMNKYKSTSNTTVQ